MTPCIHTCNQQCNNGFCMSEWFDNNPNHKRIKAVIRKICVPWWSIVWMVFKKCSDSMNQLSVPFLHEVHTSLPHPHIRALKDQKKTVSSKHRSVHPQSRNTPLYIPSQMGLVTSHFLLAIYWNQKRGKIYAISNPLPPSLLLFTFLTLVVIKHQLLFPVPFLWLWLATFLEIRLYTQTISWP